MARVTVEDCLEKVEGRFDLAILAARRAKMIQQGSKPLIETGNKNIVTALREIAAGKVWFEPRKSAEEKAGEAVEANFEEEGAEAALESKEKVEEASPSVDNTNKPE